MSDPTTPSRRDALKALSALAGAAVTAPHLSGCGDGDGETPTPGDDGPAIDTIVLVMMENRTFDHYFGSLTLDEGRDDVDGLTAEMTNPDADGVEVPPFHLTYDCLEDPPHGWTASHDQHDGGTNRGFVRRHDGGRGAVAEEVMGYYRRADLPVLYALADGHALCDRWFSSVMSSTWPNRFYAMCGTSDGMQTNDFSRVPFPARSLFDALDEAGVSWGSYASDLPFTSLLESVGGVTSERIRPVEQFFQDAEAGRLPSVVVVEPSYAANDDHPPHAISLGQLFLGTVYEALARSPQWERCLVVVTYDEHGGFYDHVPPPTVPDDHATTGFDQLGFRVPTVVCGPYVKQGEVVHTDFDHTSWLKHLCTHFGMAPWTARMAAASDLTDCLDPDRLAARDPAPPVSLPPFDVDRDALGGECFYAAPVSGQPELEQLFDEGRLDPRLDFRARAPQDLQRMLARARKWGLLRDA